MPRAGSERDPYLSLSPVLARVHQNFDHAARVGLPLIPHHDIRTTAVTQVPDEHMGGSFDGEPQRWLAGEQHAGGCQIDRELVVPGDEEIRFAVAVEIALEIWPRPFQHDAVAHVDLV